MTRLVRPEEANTCAVVVTYQPDSGLPDRIARISSLAHKLVIVDNQSTGESVGNIGRIPASDSVQIIRNDRNLGLAAALNQGLAVARAEDYRWVITFDQDTLVGESLLRELQAVYDGFPEKERIAIIGCNYWDPARGRPLVNVKRSPARPWLESRAVVTSGSLVSLAVFETVGPFLSDLFIDHVDSEYCLRARSKGYRILLALAPVMEHSLGPGRAHATAWGKVSTPDYPPARWYYIARNSLILARKYFLKEPRWISAGLAYTAIRFARVLLLEDGRTAKVGHAAAGLADGLRSGTRIRGGNRFGGRIAAS
jgi:rhamnosyltransferase